MPKAFKYRSQHLVSFHVLGSFSAPKRPEKLTLKLREAFSDQEKVTTPKSPAFAADTLGEILSSGRGDAP